MNTFMANIVVIRSVLGGLILTLIGSILLLLILVLGSVFGSISLNLFGIGTINAPHQPIANDILLFGLG